MRVLLSVSCIVLIYLSIQPHIKDRIRVPLPVRLASFEGFKAHMSLKADRTGILLVDADFSYAVFFNTEPNKACAEPPAPVFRKDKQHFKALFVRAHESTGAPSLSAIMR